MRHKSVAERKTETCTHTITESEKRGKILIWFSFILYYSCIWRAINSPSCLVSFLHHILSGIFGNQVKREEPLAVTHPTPSFSSQLSHVILSLPVLFSHLRRRCLFPWQQLSIRREMSGYHFCRQECFSHLDWKNFQKSRSLLPLWLSSWLLSLHLLLSHSRQFYIWVSKWKVTLTFHAMTCHRADEVFAEWLIQLGSVHKSERENEICRRGRRKWE